jgi:hypothetical protein
MFTENLKKCGRPEGGGGSGKSDKCGQGGEGGSKMGKFLRTSLMYDPLTIAFSDYHHHNTEFTLQPQGGAPRDQHGPLAAK